MKKIGYSLAVAGLLGAAALPSLADGSVTGNYYTLSENHPDANIPGSNYGLNPGEVQTTLGPDGLPVVTAYGQSNNGPHSPITDVNGAGEIQWWTQHGTIVTFDFTHNDAVPIVQPFNFFPPGQGSNSNGFLAVHWQGSFTGPSTFSLGADDDAWLFVDNQLVIDDGGVKDIFSPVQTGDVTTGGSHTLDLFFTDRHNVQAGIVFDSTATLVPVPEPGTIAAFAVGGLGVLGLMVRARKTGRRRGATLA